MEIEEVVRRSEVNESQRDIARAAGLARETVKKYLAAPSGLGLSATTTTGSNTLTVTSICP
jgi:transposase